MIKQTKDIITPETAKTLYGLFRERVKRTPGNIAYRYFDEKENRWKGIVWSEMASYVARWQKALKGEGLKDGDRIAIWIQNSKEWVAFDQAAFGMGRVVVPLYCNDSAENIAYILKDSGTKIVLLDGEEHWRQLHSVSDQPGADVPSLLMSEATLSIFCRVNSGLIETIASESWQESRYPRPPEPS